MKNDIEKIAGNCRLASDFNARAAAIYSGQLEEAVRAIGNSQIDFPRAAQLYSGLCGLPLLSPQFAAFCSALGKAGALKNEPQPEAEKEITVSYADNIYTRLALDSFSRTAVIHAEPENDFNAACEAVWLGRSSCCILPLCNTADGLITSMLRLAERYELKPVSAVKVLMADEVTETDFCLMSHTAYYPDNPEVLVLSLIPEYADDTAQLLLAMKKLGAVCHSINSLPLEYTDERQRYTLFFNIKGVNTAALCCFLSAALDGGSVLGIYSYINL